MTSNLKKAGYSQCANRRQIQSVLRDGVHCRKGVTEINYVNRTALFFLRRCRPNSISPDLVGRFLGLPLLLAHLIHIVLYLAKNRIPLIDEWRNHSKAAVRQPNSI